MPAVSPRSTAELMEIAERACARERMRALSHLNAAAPADAQVVVCWLARSQRAWSNAAVDTAIAIANELELPLVAIAKLGKGPRHNALRHVDHFVRGMGDVASELAERNVRFHLLAYDGPAIEHFVEQVRAAAVVCDDDVMPAARRLRARLAERIDIPCIAVESDVIVPTALFAKHEYAARTIRPKIHRVLNEWCAARPVRRGEVSPHACAARSPQGAIGMRGVTGVANDADIDVPAMLQAARNVGIDDGPTVLESPSGAAAARAALNEFVDTRLHGYATRRNKPEFDGTSGLSVHLHYGHIGIHDVVERVDGMRGVLPGEDIDAYLEELIVRRELSWNHVLHCLDPATLEGSAPAWALTVLEAHAHDVREWHYDRDELEEAETHDPLWNAAQRQLVKVGHMHGYMRMYWAKKILEWSASPSQAFADALALNDRWSLDGRDPNGNTGVAWAIGGLHDRPWSRRPIFGTVRYMSLASTGRKFDSRAYIACWS